MVHKNLTPLDSPTPVLGVKVKEVEFGEPNLVIIEDN